MDATYIAIPIRQEMLNSIASSQGSRVSISTILQAEAKEEQRLLDKQEDVPALTQELKQDENTD